MAPTPKPKHSVSARVSNSSSTWRGLLLVLAGYSQLATLQGQAQAPHAQGDRSKEFPIVSDASLAHRKGLRTSS